jgi:hypothetical protein
LPWRLRAHTTAMQWGTTLLPDGDSHFMINPARRELLAAQFGRPGSAHVGGRFARSAHTIRIAYLRPCFDCLLRNSSPQAAIACCNIQSARGLAFADTHRLNRDGRRSYESIDLRIRLRTGAARGWSDRRVRIQRRLRRTCPRHQMAINSTANKVQISDSSSICPFIAIKLRYRILESKSKHRGSGPGGTLVKRLGSQPVPYRATSGIEEMSARRPFHKICTPMQTSRNEDKRTMTVMPVGPRMRARRSANP